MLPATSASPSAATSFAIRTAWRFSSSRSSPRPDRLELVAVRVVGQRDHHVRAGAQELAVQLPQRIGLVEDHLGDERARLDVAAALELEDVALGADDDAVSEALLQGPL
jgi:hypothetical protein